MHRLNLSSYLFIVLVVLILAFATSHLLQSWVAQVTVETTGRIERAGRGY